MSGRSFLFLSCAICFLAMSAGYADDVIAPKCSIELSHAGWTDLSRDGRWLAHTYPAKNARPTRIFDLNRDPPVEVGVNIQFYGGRLDDSGRWLVDYASQQTGSEPPYGHRLWDLHAENLSPSLVLEDYQSVGITPTGAWLLARRHGRDKSEILLHAWDLQSGSLGPHSHQEIGPVSGRFVSHGCILARDGHRLIAHSADGVKLWDLATPREKPTVLTDHGDVRWAREISDSVNDYGFRVNTFWWGNARWIFWNEGDVRQCLVDLESPTPRQSRRIVLGQIHAFDGQRKVVEERDGCFWLTDLAGDSPTSHRLCEIVMDSYLSTTFLLENRWLLVTIQPKHHLAGFDGFQAYLFPVDDPSQRVVLADSPFTSHLQRGDVKHWQFASAPKGRWLVGWSGDETKYWDLLGRPTPDGLGRIEGFNGDIGSSALVARRWLIATNNRNHVFWLNLNSESPPKAVEFFHDSSAERMQVVNDYTGKRLLVCSYPPVAHIWDVSAFSDYPRE